MLLTKYSHDNTWQITSPHILSPLNGRSPDLFTKKCMQWISHLVVVVLPLLNDRSSAEDCKLYHFQKNRFHRSTAPHWTVFLKLCLHFPCPFLTKGCKLARDFNEVWHYVRCQQSFCWVLWTSCEPNLLNTLSSLDRLPYMPTLQTICLNATLALCLLPNVGDQLHSVEPC